MPNIIQLYQYILGENGSKLYVQGAPIPQRHGNVPNFVFSICIHRASASSRDENVIRKPYDGEMIFEKKLGKVIYSAAC